MSDTPEPRVIVVNVQSPLQSSFSHDVLLSADCLVHQCISTYVSPPSRLDRMLRRQSPPAPEVQAAYNFVAVTYRAGDDVMILDTMDGSYHNDPNAQNNRRATIQRLVAALDTGSLHNKSISGVVGERIPIKCVFLRFINNTPLQWSGIDRIFSDLPSTVENFLCIDESAKDGYRAYVIQRGSFGQITRKESWHCPNALFATFSWVMLQTRHIIPRSLLHSNHFKLNPAESLSTIVHSNCTKRLRGLPSDNAIPTGGQLVRIAHVDCSLDGIHSVKLLVWSSQSFAEGEYDNVCNTPLFGPEPW